MTIYRIYQKATSANIIESKKRNFGRKRTVRTKEVIEEIKEVLDSENDAQPQHNVNRGRSNLESGQAGWIATVLWILWSINFSLIGLSIRAAPGPWVKIASYRSSHRTITFDDTTEDKE